MLLGKIHEKQKLLGNKMVAGRKKPKSPKIKKTMVAGRQNSMAPARKNAKSPKVKKRQGGEGGDNDPNRL